MSKLKISESFGLPLDFVTQTQAILAKKGAGKTNTAVVQTEELLKAHQQVVIVDPTGAWWGLKSSADGKSAGYPVVIFGGEHADVPLEETAGEIVAHAIIEQRFSAILDLSLLRKGAMHRFMSAFLEALYRVNRVAMHLVVDEADTLAPQKPFGDEARTLGAMQDIVRRGRIRGIGCTLITQRPQVLNKDVLTQCEVLCTLRLSHPKDIGAIKEWIAVHGDEQTAKDMMASLPSLPIGTAWFWSPGWGDFFERVAVRRRETFDSSATPKPGEVRRAPKVIAEVDIKRLGEQVQATIQRQKENDPKELKARVRQLEQEVAKKVVQAESKEVYSADPKAIMDAVLKRDEQWQNSILEFRSNLEKQLKDLGGAYFKTPAPFTSAPVKVAVSLPSAPSGVVRRDLYATPKDSPRSMVKMASVPNGEITGPMQRILDAMVWLESLGMPEQKQVAVAFLAGYTVDGGAFCNPRGTLRSMELVEYRGDSLALTDQGRTLANQPETALTAAELQRRVLDKLPGPEQKILRAILEAYPQEISNEDAAATAGYSPEGGAYCNPRGRLRSLGLIDYRGKGQVRAADLLFI